jgi:Ras-related GTP-binding protein C/D
MDIILMGLSKCGKTSIKKVVFEKMSPHESVFLESTQTIETYKVDSLGYSTVIVRDFPNNYNFDKAPLNESKYFSTCGVLVYVIDSQESNEETYEYFKEVVVNSLNKNPKLDIEIFIHKADGAYFLKTNDMNKHRAEVQTKIKEILDELRIEINVGFYSTSIYDHSLFEAFSKIFQKILPQNGFLSSLLDNLSTSCRFEKAYLFDVYNKIYLAIDSSPMEEQFYEICSDMIDVVLDMSGIYGETNNNDIFFDENSYSLIKISNNSRSENSKSLLYLRFIDANLALISIVNEENFERQHLIDYNIKLFKEAVKEMLKN